MNALDPRARAAIALAAAAILLGGAASATLGSREGASAFTEGGGGPRPFVEDLRSDGYEVRRSVTAPAALAASAPGHTLLVVVAPTHPYSRSEARALDDFLHDGGRVLVADAFGQANSLLAGHGLVLERVRLAEGDAPIPFAIGARDMPVPLGSPTALHVAATSGAKVLARSSEGSFLDRDGDGLVAAGEPPGPFPVAAELGFDGGGRLVAVADPGLLAATDAASTAWRRALAQHLLPEGGQVLVDESRAGLDDPVLEGAASVARMGGDAGWGLALLVAGMVVAAAAMVPATRSAWAPHAFRPFRFRRRSEAFAGDAAPPRTGVAWLARGETAVIAASALALLAVATGSVEAAWAAAFLGVAAAAALQPRLPRVTATRLVEPAETSEGSTVSVRVQLSASGPAPGVEVRDLLPRHVEVRTGSEHLVLGDGRRSLALAYEAAPALRGTHAIGPTFVRSRDAFALRARNEQVAPATPLRVAPARQDVRRLPFTTRVPTITLGPHLVNRAGDGSEFQALRTYQAGDSMRSVNWKASARSRDLMVNQRVHESQALLTVFLDARAVAGAGPEARTPLAQGCRAVLSVATGALRMRDRIRLVVYGDGVRELAGTGAARQLHDLTGLLSEVRAAGSHGLGDAVATVLPSLRPGLPVLVASGLEDDPTLVDAVRELRARGLLVVVIASTVSVAPVDPEDGAAEDDGAGILQRREQTLAQLRGLGVTVHDAAPDVPLDLLFKLGAA